MYSSYNTTTYSSSTVEGFIIFIEVLVVIGTYLYLRAKVKNNESFSGMGWGFFAGIFMGGLGDIIFFALMNSLLSKHLTEGNKGKPKSKQEKNTATINALKRNLGTGLAISFIGHVIIRVLLIVVANSN